MSLNTEESESRKENKEQDHSSHNFNLLSHFAQHHQRNMEFPFSTESSSRGSNFPPFSRNSSAPAFSGNMNWPPPTSLATSNRILRSPYVPDTTMPPIPERSHYEPDTTMSPISDRRNRHVLNTAMSSFLERGNHHGPDSTMPPIPEGGIKGEPESNGINDEEEFNVDDGSVASGSPPLHIVLPTAPEDLDNSFSSTSEQGDAMMDEEKTNEEVNGSYNGDNSSPNSSPVSHSMEPGVNGFFNCNLCSYSTESQEEFEVHLASHVTYRCDKCNFASRTEGRLKKHAEQCHNNNESAQSDNPLEQIPTLDTLLAQAANTSVKQEEQDAPQKTAGRKKDHKCKYCEFTAIKKEDLWRHARSHMKEGKVLECPKCPFVTEYKHHLEYHVRNHVGSKPFKCDVCPYSCVNKSMLNSHKKSHSDVYRYRCATCSYSSKYCHTLKVHLLNRGHSPAPMLNADGTLDHDTAPLLRMKRTSRSRRIKKEKTPAADKPSQPPRQPGPRTRRPPPPQTMMPFWPSAFNGDIRPMPPPLIPSSIGLPGMYPNLMPHVSKPSNTISQEQPNSHYSNLFKCEQCEFIGKSNEDLSNHRTLCHPVAPKFFDIFGGLGASRPGSIPLSFGPAAQWNNSMLNLNRSAAASPFPFSVPQLTSAHNMPLGAGNLYNHHPHQVPVQDRKPLSPPSRTTVSAPRTAVGPPSTEATPASTAIAPPSTAVAPESLPTSSHPMEKPLDLRKSSSSFNQQTNGRKRPRKGKATRIDAIALELQDKIGIDGELQADDDDRLLEPSASSSYPSPTVSADESNSFFPIRYSREEVNNNEVLPRSNKDKRRRYSTNHIPTEHSKFDDSREINNNKPDKNNSLSANSSRKAQRRMGEYHDCQHCEITFYNFAMYSRHMSFHSFSNPFNCHKCGVTCEDSVEFHRHIGRVAHF